MSLRHWIWLTLELPQAARSVALLDALESPERIYTANRETLAATGVLKKEEIDRLLADRSLERAQAVLLRTAELGIQVITLRDAAYPDRLRNIENPPPVLYCKGTLPSVDDHVCVAVVGTRKASSRACRVAERFSYDLAKAGIIIVSGMAAGIDSQGHLGALRAGMPTIAVFGCGLDICFPAENRHLMENIIENGCILSEYPPGTPTSRYTFPARNRIISGLSMGVLVAAAPRRSGSLITARHGLEQGRDVFVIPGGIDDQEYAGGNEYIKEGAAVVTQPEDILGEYLERWPELIKPSIPQRQEMPENRQAAAVYEPAKETIAPNAAKKPRWTPNWVNPAKLVKQKSAPEEQPEPTAMCKPELQDQSLEDMPEPAIVTASIVEEPDCSALTPEDQRIIQAVRNGANHLDQIIEATGMTTDAVVSQLVVLEVEGIITKDAADHVVIAGK